MKKSIFFFTLSILLVACEESATKVISLDYPSEQITEIDWLLGEWKFEDESGVLYEEWSKANDSIYSGVSYYIEKKDTLFFETLELKIKGDSLFYTSFGEGTSSKTFKGLYEHENASFVIENPLNSFPRTVAYKHLSDTLMIIEVSGEVDGSEETQPYHMVKKKPNENRRSNRNS